MKLEFPIQTIGEDLKIIGAYGKTSRSGYVFTLLDNKPLDNDAYKKLLHQVLPK